MTVCATIAIPGRVRRALPVSHQARTIGGRDRMAVRQSITERFWPKVATCEPYECWEWQGSRTTGGYGVIKPEGSRTPVLAHRVAYELAVGPVPDGLELDHLCRNRRCVNPSHLEPVTRSENIRRQPRNQSIYCQRGHLFGAAGIAIKNGRLYRRCLVCAAASDRAAKARRRAVLSQRSA
jgi:hypothetical protein